METLAEFLKVRRKALDLTVAELANLVNLSPAILHKYLSGARALRADRALRLRDELCDSLELKDRFDALYKRSRPSEIRSPLELSIDSTNAKLRVASLDFLPFAGSKNAFMEKFVGKCLNLAVIQLEILEKERKLPGNWMPFDMTERVEDIETRKVDLLFNLISLQRMKKLSFIPTPIRISVNGVMFQREAIVVGEQNRSRLQLARGLLVHGKQPKSDPFCVVTIRHEVGHVFLEQTHNLKETKNPDRKEGLGLSCLDPQPTLDAAFLAERMRKLSEVVPVMLVSDEHTALGVVRALGGDGVLVLSPNCDQAVIHSVERRIPPAYYFGLGMRRVNNLPLIEYLQQTFSTYLSVEGESIATWIEDLYYDLVEFVKSCLAKTGIYVGGIRRTNRRVDDPAPSGVDASAWESGRRTLVEQNARAVARKSLTLSRRSLENLPLEMRAWHPILTRARERIQVADGGDRGRIRNIIIYCAKLTLGRDPFAYEPDPIELLRQLVPSFEPRPAGDQIPLGRPNGVHAISPVNCWNDFLYLLELELDMDLSSLRKCRERWFKESFDLGRLISRIQVLLEASRDSQLVLTIRDYDSHADRDAFIRLRDDYAHIRKIPALKDQIKVELPADEFCIKRIVAYNLGDAVGFLDAEILPELPSPIPGSDQAPSVLPSQIDEMRNTILVKRLHVVRHMHHAGVSRRLIRRIVEEGNETFRRAVWLERWLWEPVDLEKFRRAGFIPFHGDRLWYEFKLASSPKKLYPWDLRARPDFLR
jgi:hypothetical protein